jgi:hypothetical protein
MWKVYPAQSLTQNDSFVSALNGTQAIMSDIYVWTVPRNTAILLNPTDILSAYLKDVGAEMIATDQWELVIRNAESGEQVSKISSGIYQMVKEFQDQTKVKRIGGKYLLESDFILAFRANATTVLVNASCYISIGCTKYVKVSATL